MEQTNYQDLNPAVAPSYNVNVTAQRCPAQPCPAVVNCPNPAMLAGAGVGEGFGLTVYQPYLIEIAPAAVSTQC